MRFQSLENNRLYKLYRNDQMSRLKKKINQIKTRKNQHISNNQSHILPYISPGYGFSSQRKHQIQKQNKRLNSKIKNAKNNHSSYYIKPLNLQKKEKLNFYLLNTINTQYKRQNKIQTKQNNQISLIHTDRPVLKCLDNKKLNKNNFKDLKFNQNNVIKSFKEEIIELYQFKKRQNKQNKFL